MVIKERMNLFIRHFRLYLIKCGNIVKKYIFAPKIKINNGKKERQYRRTD